MASKSCIYNVYYVITYLYVYLFTIAFLYMMETNTLELELFDTYV